MPPGSASASRASRASRAFGVRPTRFGATTWVCFFLRLGIPFSAIWYGYFGQSPICLWDCSEGVNRFFQPTGPGGNSRGRSAPRRVDAVLFGPFVFPYQVFKWCPVTVSFLGEGSPTKIDRREGKGHPHSNLSSGGPSWMLKRSRL